MTNRTSPERQQANNRLWEAATADVKPLGTHHSLPVKTPPMACPRPLKPISTRCLDLHGLSVSEAFRRTGEFLQVFDRNAIVITGRSGVIRAEFKDWVRQHHRVVSIDELNGGGAFRIHCKRKT